MIILAIDPSVAQRSGWATYDTETKVWKWGHFDSEGINFKVRCANLKSDIIRKIGHFDEFVGEWPMYYASERGQIAAQQSYTINLAGMIMYIVGWFQLESKLVHLYTAPDWKGSVPKQVTARRFYKHFGIEIKDVDHNTIDACMMLLNHLQLCNLL